MAKPTTSLLSQVQSAVLDEDASLAGALRKILVLAGKSDAQELRAWATKELQGYGPDDSLPSYRVVQAELLIDGISGNYQITGERVSSASLPEIARGHIDEEVKFRQGVAEIEAMIKQADSDDGRIKLSPQGAAELVNIWNSELQTPYRMVSALYWAISSVTLRGIVDQIRTKLAQLVAEIRSEVQDVDSEPSSEAVRQAANIVISGRARVKNINTQQSANSNNTSMAVPSNDDDESPTAWYLTKKFWAFAIGLMTIAGGVAAIFTWAPWH